MGMTLRFTFFVVAFYHSQVHAAIPRLVLHLHDDDINVRQACRVFSYNPFCSLRMNPTWRFFNVADPISLSLPD
jgi:hypothetical protein